MIEKLTPDFRFICDRCGKVQESIDPDSLRIKYVSFSDNPLSYRGGEVCEECHNDFCELINNFFDEVNKTEEGGEG